jgi:hypothetical protein
MSKREGLPAREYLEAVEQSTGGGGSISPSKSFRDGKESRLMSVDDFEHIGEREEEDGGDDDDEYEGLENVRACCDGAHDIGCTCRSCSSLSMPSPRCPS